MSIIPEHIDNIEEARGWLLRHGYSAEMAAEELANWVAPEVIIEEPAEEEWEDEEEWEEDEEEWEEEDEEWDEEEDEDDQEDLDDDE